MAAIAQLEARRATGAEFFVLPNSALWWMDHYVGFRHHLIRQYQPLTQPTDAGLVFDLRKPAILSRSLIEVAGDMALTASDGVSGGGGSVLDWHTEVDLSSALPGHTVFAPPERDQTLPYMDHSVDIVAVRDPDAAQADEARRVAKRAVVIFTDRPDTAGPTLESHVERFEPQPATSRPSISIMVPVAPGDPVLHARLAAICASLPHRADSELLVAGLQLSDRDVDTVCKIQREYAFVRLVETNEQAAAHIATNDVLIFLGDDVLPLPDFLSPLLQVLVHSPQAAVVGGRVVGSDGRLSEAGGTILTDGSLQLLGVGDLLPDAPVHSFVREAAWCSRSILATWRGVFEDQHGFDMRYSSRWFQDADYCLRVGRHGRRVYYQPASVGVRLGAARLPTDSPDRLAFAEQWAEVNSLGSAR
jgi:hypothetical protein